MNKVLVLTFIFLSLLGPRYSYGDDHRMQNRFGLTLGIFSDPLLSMGEINVCYNVNDFLRFNGGLGFTSVSSTTTAYYPDGTTTTVNSGNDTGFSGGVGIKALVPHWEFSPTIGLNLSESVYTLAPGTESFYFNGNSNANLSVAFLCPNFGFDYQAKDGFDIGMEFNLPIILSANAEVILNTSVIPGLNVGKFF